MSQKLGFQARMGFHVAFLAQLESSWDLKGCVPARITQSPFPALCLTVNVYVRKGEKLQRLMNKKAPSGQLGVLCRVLSPQPLLCPPVPLFLSSPYPLPCCYSLSTDRSPSHPGPFALAAAALEVCTQRLTKAM